MVDKQESEQRGRGKASDERGIGLYVLRLSPLVIKEGP